MVIEPKARLLWGLPPHRARPCQSPPPPAQSAPERTPAYTAAPSYRASAATATAAAHSASHRPHATTPTGPRRSHPNPSQHKIHQVQRRIRPAQTAPAPRAPASATTPAATGSISVRGRNSMFTSRATGSATKYRSGSSRSAPAPAHRSARQAPASRWSCVVVVQQPRRLRVLRLRVERPVGQIAERNRRPVIVPVHRRRSTQNPPPTSDTSAETRTAPSPRIVRIPRRQRLHHVKGAPVPHRPGHQRQQRQQQTSTPAPPARAPSPSSHRAAPRSSNPPHAGTTAAASIPCSGRSSKPASASAASHPIPPPTSSRPPHQRIERRRDAEQRQASPSAEPPHSSP